MTLTAKKAWWLKPVIIANVAMGLGAADVLAAGRTASVPLPRPRPTLANVAPSKQSAPLALTPRAVTAAPAPRAPAGRPSAPALPRAFAAGTTASAADLAAVKQIIDYARRGRTKEAVALSQNVGDPVARKLVEWVLLRSDDTALDFSRYASFLVSNPGWPSLTLLRRKAEAVLWQDRVDNGTIAAFFANTKPTSTRGRLAYARALLAEGDRAGAQRYIRETWREDALSRDLEAQLLTEFGLLLTPADYKARMDTRLYAEDVEAGLRAAQKLGGAQLAIAKVRAAVIKKAANAGSLLDAVPQEARNDPVYIFSRVQWLRRADHIADAAKWLLSAPRDPSVLHDTDSWWEERRLVARKLLDLNDPQTAYRIVKEAAPAEKENYQVDQHFTPGWIALRAFNEPAKAAAHFAAIPNVAEHPASFARAYYWLGRAAEAAGRREEARAQYERGAQYPTTYYGQLARAKLGPGEIALHRTPEAVRDLFRLEVVRAVEILYAIGEKDLVASMVAGLTDRADADVLATLATVTTRHEDARATLLIGKGALARGLPFDVYAYPTEGLPRYTALGHAVEPQVAYSIARQESAFNPRAVSSANALGLLQVTPATAKDVTKRIGLNFDRKRLLSDPVYNVQIGAAQLGKLIDNYNGSYILAFAAYNAGPGRARDWIAQYGDPRDPSVDPVDWVERIPFLETRSYVQRILENIQVYRVRFGATRKLMIEADLRRGSELN